MSAVGSDRGASRGSRLLGGLGAIVFALALVEVTSGILQGYYTPIFTDIARNLSIHDADVNWFEAGQLMFSALSVPVLAKMGDLWGHKKVLLWATLITAVASFGVALAPNFATYLVAWTLQGAYAVWLPLEIALIYLAARSVTGDAPGLTRKAAGLLVFALEAGVIVGALSAGALVEVLPLTVVLMIPAFAVVACYFAILVLVPELPANAEGRLDVVGIAWLACSLILLMAGLSLVRIAGLGSVWTWLCLMAALLALVPFVRHELADPEPLVDIRMLVNPNMWPVQLTAGLFGVSVLGAQAPLSTFARTDPGVTGYGLGLSAGQVSIIIGAYVLSMGVGALMLPALSRWLTPRYALVVAAGLVAVGYLMFLPFHHTLGQTLTNMIVAGLGSGLLVAALPSAAAAAAASHRTGMATGLTNSIKTVGGSVASAVFGVALFQGVSEAAVAAGETAAPLAGYMTVWTLCGVTAAVCALLLAAFVPKKAFTVSAAVAEGPPPTSPA
ncbi:MAG: MFS transporter [bacterium]|nr:MFS transporter [bacterium]